MGTILVEKFEDIEVILKKFYLANTTENEYKNNENLLLLNPLLTADLQKELLTIANTKKFSEPHIWITSSGSSAKSERHLKLIALSKTAFIQSAKAVNQHLEISNHTDKWLNILPPFHVGALGIFFRTFESCDSVKPVANYYSRNWKWNPNEFCQILVDEQITLTSLVPTQVFDLVSQQLIAPQKLRAIVVGGAALESNLYHKAIQLGWPLLPSYGLTEFCSQVATAELRSLSKIGEYPYFKGLNHLELKTTQDGTLKIKGHSMLTGYFDVTDESHTWVEPIVDKGWYQTQDQVNLNNGYLTPLGRNDDIVKILGENTNIAFLRERMSKIISDHYIHLEIKDWALLTKPHERKGNEIVFCWTGKSSLVDSVNELVSHYNNDVLPYERITEHKKVEIMPKTALGKIQYQQLRNQL